MDARRKPLSRCLRALAARPGGLLGRAGGRDRLVRKAEKGLRQIRRHLRPLVHRRRRQHLLQRARPPRRQRPKRPGGADLRFPRHQQQADLQLRPPALRGAAARRHAARFRRDRRATASFSTCRWCQRPVIGMLACARIGAMHSVVFGGFAAKELATRIDDAKPKVILSASCGIEVDRVVPYKPLLDEAIRLARHKPHDLPDPAASAMPGGTHAGPRPRLAQDLGARRRIRQDLGMRAGPRHRPALHSLHLRHDGHPQGRGARQWRPSWSR